MIVRLIFEPRAAVRSVGSSIVLGGSGERNEKEGKGFKLEEKERNE